MNHERVARIYRQEVLQVRIKHRRKLAAMARSTQSLPTERNERWALDSVADALADGRRFCALTVVDIYSRECVGIEVDRELPAARVTEALNRFIGRHGKPRMRTMDNGTEFRSSFSLTLDHSSGRCPAW